MDVILAVTNDFSGGAYYGVQRCGCTEQARSGLMMRAILGNGLRRVITAQLTPVFAKQFKRMLGAIGSIATHHVVSGTVFVATPANSFRVGRMYRKFLFHFFDPDLKRRMFLASRVCLKPNTVCVTWTF